MRRSVPRRRLVQAAVALLLAITSVTAPGLGSAPVGADDGRGRTEGFTDWSSVSAGYRHTCGIRAGGQLFCWGSDGDGQLGDDAAIANQAAPVEVAGGFTDWFAVSAGYGHTCGIRTNARLYCWGLDSSGQLGNGEPLVSQPTPVEVAGGITDWAAVNTSGGGEHTCALRTEGKLYCWGDDTWGQLGNGSPTENAPSPVEVAGNRSDWVAVSAGGAHTCARRSSGRLFCWGSGDSGERGDGTFDASQPAPVQVSGQRTDWKSVSAGGGFTCGRRTNGRLYCWGSDGEGRLGNGGPTTNRSTPTQVAGALTDWTTVSAGRVGHACGRRSTGALYCWGDDGSGGLGDGAPLADQAAPVAVAGGHTDWTTVSAGAYHACGRRSTGRLYCWGWDFSGQLGNGAPNADRPNPGQVAGVP